MAGNWVTWGCALRICVSMGKKYVLVFNSWGQIPEKPNALHYSLSGNLRDWSPPQRLAAELAQKDRVIDGALAWTGTRWMLACKWWNQLRMAYAESLEGPWRWIEEAPARLLENKSGQDNGYRHENFQLLQFDGNWHLLSTDYIPKELNHHPWLYCMEGDPNRLDSWTHWTKGRRLQVPVESWNQRDPDNAAALLDLRSEYGVFYLIYGGKNDERIDEFRGTAACEKAWPRGWNRLGLAWSADLVNWETEIP